MKIKPKLFTEKQPTIIAAISAYDKCSEFVMDFVYVSTGKHSFKKSSLSNFFFGSIATMEVQFFQLLIYAKIIPRKKLLSKLVKNYFAVSEKMQFGFNKTFVELC